MDTFHTYTHYRRLFSRASSRVMEDLLAVGGKLSSSSLLAAYHEGVYPCYGEHEKPLWWSPLERCIISQESLHCSRTLKRQMKKVSWNLSLDKAFPQVISACSEINSSEDNYWLLPEMQEAYTELHALGYLHSLEVWQDGELIGGLYGLALGRCFCGESMFFRVSGASKIGLFCLASYLFSKKGFLFIDCQQNSAHMVAMGAYLLSRREFRNLLRETLSFEDYRGNWGEIFFDFPRAVSFFNSL